MINFIAFVVSMLLWLPIAALWGWAISLLWEWFIVPAFNLPIILMHEALGLAVVMSLLTKNVDTTDTRDYVEQLVSSNIIGVLRPLLAVGVGWVYLKVFF